MIPIFLRPAHTTHADSLIESALLTNPVRDDATAFSLPQLHTPHGSSMPILLRPAHSTQSDGAFTPDTLLRESNVVSELSEALKAPSEEQGTLRRGPSELASSSLMLVHKPEEPVETDAAFFERSTLLLATLPANQLLLPPNQLARLLLCEPTDKCATFLSLVATPPHISSSASRRFESVLFPKLP